MSKQNQAVSPISNREVSPCEEAIKLRKALAFYRQAKQEQDRNVLINEDWFCAKHWKHMKGERPSLGHEPTTPFILNAVWHKHADAMDQYPEPIFLEREATDRPLAESLSKIIPLILEKNDFEKVYSDIWWQKLKHGTGLYYVGWDNSKENGLGDIVIRKIDLLRFYAEPHLDDIQHSRYIFLLSLADTAELQRKYPDKRILSDADSMRLESYFGCYEPEALTGKSCLVDCYEKCRNDRGKEVVHLTKLVGDEIVYSTKTDPAFAQTGLYEHGQYPFVADPFIPNESSIYGRGLTEIARPTQEYIDRLDYLIEANCLVSGKQRFVVKRSSGIRPEDLMDLRRDLIECDSSAEDGVIRPLQASPFPSHVMEHRQNKVEELKEVVGNRDFSQGGTLGGVTAYKSISALQEAGNKLSRDLIHSSYRAFRQVVELCVELIRQFYDETRSFRILGEEGEVEYLTLDNRPLKPRAAQGMNGATLYRKAIFDIKIISARKTRFDAEKHNELIRELYQAGAFTPEGAASSIVALDAMMLENKDKIIRRLQQIAAEKPSADPSATALSDSRA